MSLPPTQTPVNRTRAALPAGIWNIWILHECLNSISLSLRSPCSENGGRLAKGWILQFAELDFSLNLSSMLGGYSDFTIYYSEHLLFVSGNISSFGNMSHPDPRGSDGAVHQTTLFPCPPAGLAHPSSWVNHTLFSTNLNHQQMWLAENLQESFYTFLKLSFLKHSYFLQSLVVKKFFWFYVAEYVPNKLFFLTWVSQNWLLLFVSKEFQIIQKLTRERIGCRI